MPARQKTVFAAEQDPPEVARRGASFKKFHRGSIRPASSFVIVDGTWSNEYEAHPLAWQRRCAPVKAKAPHGCSDGDVSLLRWVTRLQSLRARWGTSRPSRQGGAFHAGTVNESTTQELISAAEHHD
jgi:hypothetical protein